MGKENGDEKEIKKEIDDKFKKEYEKAFLNNGWKTNIPYVFISYSGEDWKKVYPAVLALRFRGMNVYMDTEFKENASTVWLGNFQNRVIEDPKCKGVVAFVSIHYLRSYACLIEQLAGKTNLMNKKKGHPLPMFYMALEDRMKSPQGIFHSIYDDTISDESFNKPVTMGENEEKTLIRYMKGSTDENIVKEVEDYKKIKTCYDVTVMMYTLIFNKDYSSVAYDTAEDCADTLFQNFTGSKNKNINLEPKERIKDEVKGLIDKYGKLGGKNWMMEDLELCVSKMGSAEDVESFFASGDVNAGGSGGVNGSASGGVNAVENVGGAAAEPDRSRVPGGEGNGAASSGGTEEKGESVSGLSDDEIKKFRDLLRRADAGDLSAQNELGYCYAKGKGTEKNPQEAFRYYKRAADGGHVPGLKNEGVCYFKGEGVERNYKKAIECFEKVEKAASGGKYKAAAADAQFYLALCYRNGYGVPADGTKAAEMEEKSRKNSAKRYESLSREAEGDKQGRTDRQGRIGGKGTGSPF